MSPTLAPRLTDPDEEKPSDDTLEWFDVKSPNAGAPSEIHPVAKVSVIKAIKENPYLVWESIEEEQRSTLRRGEDEQKTQSL